MYDYENFSPNVVERLDSSEKELNDLYGNFFC